MRMSCEDKGRIEAEAIKGPVLSGASQSAITYHYDIGRSVYSLFLDNLLVYSAACWEMAGKRATSLEEAQVNKINYHLDAARVGQGSRVLDIGCGWGALLRTAIHQRNALHVTGLTLSEDQFDFVKGLQLPRASVRLTSYETFEADQPFDAIVSIGAFEHFAQPGMDQGQRVQIYRNFFQKAARWLSAGGMLSLQTIYWADIDRHYANEIVPLDVFPESDLPFMSEIFEASRSTLEPVHMTTGTDDYIMTLNEWFRRLKARRPELECQASTRDLYPFFENYFRTSIVGFKKRRIGLCRIAFRRLDRVKDA